MKKVWNAPKIVKLEVSKTMNKNTNGYESATCGTPVHSNGRAGICS